MKQQIILLAFFTIIFLAQTNAQSPNLWEKYCAPTSVLSGSETAYSDNLASAFSDIIGFAGKDQLDGVSNTYGADNPAVMAQALYYCRGESSGITTAQCQACVADAQLQLAACTTRTEAIVWYEECTVHVANRDMRGVLQTQPSYILWSLQTATPPTIDVSEPVRNLVLDVVNKASMDTTHGYADGSVQLTSDATYYVMAQCSADIIAVGGSQVCTTCLQSCLKTLQLNEDIALKDTELLAQLMPSCQILLGYLSNDPSSSSGAPSPQPSIPSLVQPSSNSTALAPSPAMAASAPMTLPADAHATAPPTADMAPADAPAA